MKHPTEQCNKQRLRRLSWNHLSVTLSQNRMNDVNKQPRYAPKPNVSRNFDDVTSNNVTFQAYNKQKICLFQVKYHFYFHPWSQIAIFSLVAAPLVKILAFETTRGNKSDISLKQTNILYVCTCRQICPSMSTLMSNAKLNQGSR